MRSHNRNARFVPAIVKRLAGGVLQRRAPEFSAMSKITIRTSPEGRGPACMSNGRVFVSSLLNSTYGVRRSFPGGGNLHIYICCGKQAMGVKAHITWYFSVPPKEGRSSSNHRSTHLSNGRYSCCVSPRCPLKQLGYWRSRPNWGFTELDCGNLSKGLKTAKGGTSLRSGPRAHAATTRMGRKD